jgi:D-glycero-D-manno-heptose 1,7-bisphosphate phosphatase
VILDRDGVLNREGAGPVTAPRDWVWEDGGLDALDLLAAHGALVSIVTNQSCIGRGLASQADVDGLHGWLAAELTGRGVRLVGIFTCPHAPDAGCRCRKPAPGLVLDAVRSAGVPPAETLLVGDADRDVVAGRAAGVTPFLVGTGKGRSRTAGSPGRPAPSPPPFDDVCAAVVALLGAHPGAGAPTPASPGSSPGAAR